MEDFADCYVAILGRGDLERTPCSSRNLFFTWEMFAEHRQSVNRCNCKFLSKGDRNSEWWDSTSARRFELYESLILVAKPMLEESMGRSIDLNQTQVLVGHLCMSLAGRVARTLAQASSLEGRLVLSQKVSSYTFIRPINSHQSYKLLTQADFSQFLDTALLSIQWNGGHHFEISINQPDHPGKTRGILERLYIFTASLLAPLTRRSKTLIIGSYLGRHNEIFLNLLLGQAPFLAEVRDQDEHDATSSIGPLGVEIGSLDDLFKCALGVLIPLKLRQKAASHNEGLARAGWPKSPKTIFTSNNFDTDDDFKLYLANHWKNAKYVVGQHGNNYGTSQDSRVRPETWMADQFLTWGWKGAPNTKAFGVIKPVKKVLIKRKKKGFLIILRDDLWLQTESDSGMTNEKHFGEIADLTARLIGSGCRVKVRPHPGTPSWVLARIAREASNSPLLSFSKPNRKLFEDRRHWFPVFGYDSTGMLELASIGEDFYAYVPDGLGAINEEFLDVYLELENLNLLAVSPKVAHEDLIAIRDLNFMLSSEQRQGILRLSSQLAIREKNLIYKIARLLIALSQQGSISEARTVTRWPSRD